MPVIPLLPLFHKFNSQYFENSLTVNNQPLVKVRWSDNRLKTTAGFYKRKRINGFVDSEIILGRWQRLFFVELDCARPRRLFVQIQDLD